MTKEQIQALSRRFQGFLGASKVLKNRMTATASNLMELKKKGW